MRLGIAECGEGCLDSLEADFPGDRQSGIDLTLSEYLVTAGCWSSRRRFSVIPIAVVLGGIAGYGGPSGSGEGATTIAIGGTGLLFAATDRSASRLA